MKKSTRASTKTKPKATAKKDPSRELAKTIAQIAYDTKAEHINVLDLTKLPTFTDYFVICSGRSDRQVQAIADNISKFLKSQGRLALSIEGYQQGHWCLMDYGSVVAHIFYEETRAFYGIEKFWSDAPVIEFKLK